MTDPIQRVSRSYRIHTQWYDWEHNPDRQTGGLPSPKPIPAIPAADELNVQYEFDRFAQMVAEQLAAVLSAAETLKPTAETLKDASAGSILSRRTAEWAPGPALSAKVTDNARIYSYLIRLDSVARMQRNIGFAQKRTEISPLAGSLCEFELSSCTGHTRRLSVAFGPTDTNEQALRRIRRAVNDAEAGVTALLIRDRRENKLTLELRAEHTGASGAFSLTDVRGEAVAFTGIDRMVQAAENAVYTINEGTLVSSASNEVKLDEGRLTLMLKEASAESVILSVYPDAAAIKKRFAEVIAGYNQLIAALQEAAEVLNPDISRDLLEGMPQHVLEELGILKQADDTLQLDEEKLVAQIRFRFDMVAARLTESSGLIDHICHAANQLTTSSPETLLNKQNGAYRALMNYAYGPDKRLRSYLPVPITGYLLNFYS
ncbi:flagellar filament capping protein FliD [Paenibacillus naphthalenovorans]|uniref:flagellar filament capping protein FliD n=1 Tax=Paenibacillus naphthalenovorans TaxID=162209 RepID=UPI003D2A87D3